MASDDDRPDARDEVEDVVSAPGPPSVRKDRREHGGWSQRSVDDALAERTEEERVEAGLAAYDPDDVPPATDDSVPTDFSEDELTQEIEGEIDREAGEGEWPTKGDEFPPSHYSRE